MQWFEVFARPRRNLVALGSALMLGLSSAAVAAPLVVDQQASSVGVTFTQMNLPVDAQFTRFDVPGELTIKGVTQAVTAPVSVSQEEGRFVFVGEVPIKRLAFGIGAGEWKDTSLVADAVIVKFKIVATQP